MDKIYRNSLFSPVLALVLGYGICLPVVGQAAEKKSIPLIQIKNYDTSKIAVKGNVTIGKRDDAFIVTIKDVQNDRWPSVFLKPQGEQYFDLSAGSVLAMDITNLEKHQIEILCKIMSCTTNGADGKEVAESGISLYAGETATLRIPYHRNDIAPADVTIHGVFAPANGLYGGSNIDPSRVNTLRFFVENVFVMTRFAIRNIRVETSPEPVSEAVKSAKTFYPFIDIFGQYKHADWTGKVHSRADLVAARQAEETDIAAHPGAPDRTKFGGWASGPSFKATGNFYPVKYEGKWWLVDPSGKLFFSHGIDQFWPLEPTIIANREHYFEDTPDVHAPENRDFREWYRPGLNAKFKNLKNRNKDYYSFSFYTRNLFWKYGTDWKKRFVELSRQRAKSWEINTIGNWSDLSVYQDSPIPFVLQTEASRGVLRLHKQRGRFYDVFAPDFQTRIVESIHKRWSSVKDSPMCIGTFVDNELPWGWDDTALAREVLRTPSDQPAKQEFCHRLQQKYGSVQALNKAWKTEFSSWNDFLNKQEVPKNVQHIDLQEFYRAFIDRYFQSCRDAVREAMPGKLYLGCRFFGTPPKDVIRGAAKYCDIVSFNIYRYSVTGFRDLPDGLDKPVIIGEFHFGIMREQFRGGIAATTCAGEQERGNAYRRYVTSVLRNPNFVGCHYYRLVDQPCTARVLDQENLGIGFVDVCDRPNPELVEAARDVGSRMYQIRSQAPRTDYTPSHH